MSDPAPAKKSYAALCICLLVIAYLGYRLHKEEKRTTPPPQVPLPTFESRIEPLREHASDWDAGYFFLVGNHESRPRPQVQPAVYTPEPSQPRMRGRSRVYDPSRPATSGNRILDSIRRQNDEWDAYMQQQRQQFDEW